VIRVRVSVAGAPDREVVVDRELIVGRKAPADVVIDDPAKQISSRHLRLRPDGERLLVADLGSTNGTRIDGGERLAPEVDTPLGPGQRLQLGAATLELADAGPAESDSGFRG
jgi:S-DNA-T family DNA segregation ATPase FtsK/SpoIIIE